MQVSRQMQKENLRYTRIDAVDGRALTKQERNSNVTALGRRLLTAGMIGCFLSHRKCWEICIRNDKPHIVFEDDVMLVDGFCDQLNAVMKDLPEDWDVLLLGAFGCVHPSGVYGPFGSFKLFGLVGGGTRETKVLPGGRVHIPWRPYGTHAYLISPRGARKLLSLAPRANFHVDNVAWGFRELNLYAVHPLLAKQTHGDTTVGGLERSWVPGWFTQMDEYTGVSFEWAWNSPMVQLGGSRGVLITVGRLFSSAVIGLVLSLGHFAWTGSLIGVWAYALYFATWTLILRILAFSFPEHAPLSEGVSPVGAESSGEVGHGSARLLV